MVVSIPLVRIDLTQCKDDADDGPEEGEQVDQPNNGHEVEVEVDKCFHDVPIQDECGKSSNVDTEVLEDDLINSEYGQSNDEILNEKKRAPTTNATSGSKPP